MAAPLAGGDRGARERGRSRSRKTSARSSSSIARSRSRPIIPRRSSARIKALSLLGRAKEAFAAIDAVLAAEGRVFPGEVYYWRAWNFTQIQDLDMAWTAIEQANRLWVNSEVSKLGGIIAYRRLQRPAAVERFTAAQKLAPDDCENSYYLGIVHAEQRDWPATKNVFDGAASCLDAAREGLRKEIAHDRGVQLGPGPQDAADRTARDANRRRGPHAGDLLVQHGGRELQSRQ